jgi:hypothetical protein
LGHVGQTLVLAVDSAVDFEELEITFMLEIAVTASKV